MDELYTIHSSFQQPNTTTPVGNMVDVRGGDCDEVMGGSDMSDFLKDQIANHPLYPKLVSSYIECRKVGAPPEMASLLEEISKGSYLITSPIEVGADPELDKFMESYCEALVRYKEELLKPFDEATTFFSNVVSQLTDLCKENVTKTTSSSLISTNYHSDDAGGTSDEEMMYDVEATESQESSCGGQGENELKEMLMRKYSGYLSNLRKEFLKKRKKGKLPKNARNALLDWWNTHYRWPYPTEEEKSKLSEVTGLDQKQINNWFINQRKRHWKPSEDMRFALMQGFTSSLTAPMHYDSTGNAAGSYGST